MNNKNNILFIGLGVVIALLLGLVGIMAYKIFSDDKPTVTTTPTTETTAAAVTTARDTATTTASAPAQQQEASRPTEIEDIYDRSSYHLTGTIAGQGVVVDLNYYDDNSLSGSYYYTKFGHYNDALQLNGSMSSNGKVYLTEYNSEKGYDSGYLEGRLNRDGTLTGHFTNSRGNTYRVSLKVK